MKVWVVTDNGYQHAYGVDFYILGVFDNKEDAEKIANAGSCFAEVNEMELNTEYPLVPCKSLVYGDNLQSAYHVGTYIE